MRAPLPAPRQGRMHARRQLHLSFSPPCQAFISCLDPYKGPRELGSGRRSVCLLCVLCPSPPPSGLGERHAQQSSAGSQTHHYWRRRRPAPPRALALSIRRLHDFSPSLEFPPHSPTHPPTHPPTHHLWILHAGPLPTFSRCPSTPRASPPPPPHPAGVLAGALVSGVQMAVSMSNTGGAWDNAKKYIEAGNTEHARELGGKGSDAHKVRGGEARRGMGWCGGWGNLGRERERERRWMACGREFEPGCCC